EPADQAGVVLVVVTLHLHAGAGVHDLTRRDAANMKGELRPFGARSAEHLVDCPDDDAHGITRVRRLSAGDQESPAIHRNARTIITKTHLTIMPRNFARAGAALRFS